MPKIKYLVKADEKTRVESMKHHPKPPSSSSQPGELARQGGRPEYTCLSDASEDSGNSDDPHLILKLVVSHADNHLFHLTIVSD